MPQRLREGRVCIQQPADQHSGFASYMAYLLHVIMWTEKSLASGILPLAMDNFIKTKVGQGNL